MSKRDDIQARISSVGSQKSVWTSLLEHPGWKLFIKTVLEQKQSRQGEVFLRPLKDMDEVPAQEFMKGEISGLALVEVLAQTQIEMLNLELKTLNLQLETEDVREKAASKPDAGSRVDSDDWHGE